MVLIEAEVIGLDKFNKGTKNLRSLEKKISRKVRRQVVNIPKSKYTELSSLYKKSPTKLANIQAEIQASSSDITEQAIVFNEGTARGRQLGSVRTTGTSVEGVIRKFKRENNTIFITVPSVSKSKVIALNPRSGDLVVTKDNRGKNLYNIGLSNRAIQRVIKEFSENVRKLLQKEAEKDFVSIKRTSGIKVDIAGKLGVSADRIHIVPSVSNIDITAKVRAQVRRNMSQNTSTMTRGRALAMTRLVDRTGGLIRSIHNVRVTSSDSIGYTYDEKTYGIHEKPLGSVTEITPKNSKVLVFTNLKTGEKVFTRKVRVKARPVIKRSIREVALKLFGKRFNIQKD